MKNLWGAIAAGPRPRASLLRCPSLSLCAGLALTLVGCADSATTGGGGRKTDGSNAAKSGSDLVAAKTAEPSTTGTVGKTTDASPTAGTTTTGTGSEGSFATVPAPDPSATEPAAEYRLDADLPYRVRRNDPVTHEVDFQVVVTPPYHAKLLKVWLPLPQSDAGQEIDASELSTFPMEVQPQITTEPVYGNRFAYFEFAKPEGAQIIRHKFTAKVWELHWDVDPAMVAAVEKWPESFAAYLHPQPMTKQKEFDDVLRQAVAKKTTPAQDMFAVMDWIDANLKYGHVKASLRADPEHAFSQMCGHCSDYHGLCLTMGRSLGYPTRLTYGWSLFPKNSPSHCKMETFLPSFGWVSFDVSETQLMVKAVAADAKLSEADKKRLTAAARQRLRSGFRENSWLLLTKGTEYELVPKALAPVRVVRTIYVEADGQVLPDPDPANSQKREFAWMTVHQYKADKPFAKPFKDFATLDAK